MARRTEVTVDLVIGRVSFAGGRVAIPATVEGGGGGTGGGGGGGGRGGGGSGSAAPGGIGALADIFGAAGAFRLRRQLMVLESLFGAVGRAGAGVSTGLIAALGAVAVAVVGVLFWVKALKVGIELVGAAAKLWFGGLLRFTQMLADGFMNLAKTIMGQTVAALQAFAGAVFGVVKKSVEAVGQFAKNAAAGFADFQQEIANTVAVMGVFGAEGLKLRETLMDFAENVATRSRYSATEFAKALYEVASAGWGTKESIAQVTEAAMALAAATLSDLVPTSEFLSTTLNTFALSADKAAQVADVFTQAINKSPGLMRKLTDSFKYIGPVAHQAGLSLKEVTAELEGLYFMGFTGSMAGTYLRQSLISLVAPTMNARKAFAAFNVDIDKFNPLKNGGLLPVIEKLQQLQETLGQSNLAQMVMNAFRARGSGAILGLINIGAERLKQLKGELNETGVAARTAADQLNTLQGAWLQIKNLWENIYIETMRGGLNVGIAALLDLLRDLQKQALNSGVFRLLGAALSQVAGVVSVLAQQVGPVLLKDFQELVGMLPGFIAQVGTAVAGATPELLKFAKSLPGLIGGSLTKLLPSLLAALTTGLPVALNFIATILPQLVGVFGAFADVVTNFLSANGGNLVTWFSLFLGGVLQIVQWLPKLVPLVTTLLSGIIQLGQAIQGKMGNGLTMLFNLLSAVAPVLLNLALTVVPVLLTALTDVGNLLTGEGGAALQNYALLLTYVLYLLATNWPTIMQLVYLGLVFMQNGLTMTTNAMVQLLPWVTWLLTTLRDTWPNIMGFAAQAIDFIAAGIEGVVGWLAVLAPWVAGIIVGFTALATVLDAVSLGLATIAELLEQVITSIMKLPEGWGEFANSWKNWFKGATTDWGNFGQRTAATWKMADGAVGVGGAIRQYGPDVAKGAGNWMRQQAEQNAYGYGAPGYTPDRVSQTTRNMVPGGAGSIKPPDLNINLTLDPETLSRKIRIDTTKMAQERKTAVRIGAPQPSY